MQCAQFIAGIGWNVPLDTALLVILCDDWRHRSGQQKSAHDLGGAIHFNPPQ
jgi:hypothetical protein